VVHPVGHQARFFVYWGLIICLLCLAGPSCLRQEPREREDAAGEAMLYTVTVDGEPVATVDEAGREQVLGRLAAVQERESLDKRLLVSFKEQVATRPAGGPGGPTSADSPFRVCSLLERRLTRLVEAVVVTVDGEDVVALPDRAAAVALTEAVTAHYREQVEARIGKEHRDVRRSSLSQLDIVERLEFNRRPVELSQVQDAETALKILLRGTTKEVFHTVAAGDCLWTIARRYGLEVNDLRQANPQVSGDTVRPGDRLSLIVPDPYLTVVSRETVVYARVIPYNTVVVQDDSMWPWEQKTRQTGIHGQEIITQENTRHNGLISQSRIVKRETTKHPRTNIIAQGCRPVPDRGTGSLMWPVQGRITSRFGWRRGHDWHGGLDIAAPRGTPVRAADGGTVIRACWLGSYGRCVFIDHGAGEVVTVYGHLNRIDVAPGDVVARGQQIGTIGSSGRSTGPHLHFEVRLEGRKVDPLEIFKQQTK